MESDASGRGTERALARIERLLEYVVGLLGVTLMVLVLQFIFSFPRP